MGYPCTKSFIFQCISIPNTIFQILKFAKFQSDTTPDLNFSAMEKKAPLSSSYKKKMGLVSVVAAPLIDENW